MSHVRQGPWAEQRKLRASPLRLFLETSILTTARLQALQRGARLLGVPLCGVLAVFIEALIASGAVGCDGAGNVIFN